MLKKISFLCLLSVVIAGNVGYNYQNPAITTQQNVGHITAVATSNSHRQTAAAPLQTTLEKHFYYFSAPEEQFDQSKEIKKVIGSPKKNLRVIFIKSPENKGYENAVLNLAKNAVQQTQTHIYVLNKQPDIAGLAQKFQIAQAANHQHKPEVHFVKYNTAADAEHAQQTIKAHYDALGGGQGIHINGGVAPVINFINSASSEKKRISNVNREYLAPSTKSQLSFINREYLAPSTTSQLSNVNREYLAPSITNQVSNVNREYLAPSTTSQVSNVNREYLAPSTSSQLSYINREYLAPSTTSQVSNVNREYLAPSITNQVSNLNREYLAPSTASQVSNVNREYLAPSTDITGATNVNTNYLPPAITSATNVNRAYLAPVKDTPVDKNYANDFLPSGSDVIPGTSYIPLKLRVYRQK